MKRLLLSLTVMLLMGGISHAQKDTVHVQGYYESGATTGTLNDAIETAKQNGDINNTVFELTPYEVYVLDRSIFMEEGQNLEIVAPEPLRAGEGTAEEVQNSAPPQIVWTDEEGVDRTYMIQTYGDVTMKNIWVRMADLLGNQVGSSIAFEDSLALNDIERGTFEGVIFEYTPLAAESGGAVLVKADNFQGIFKKVYFRNLVDTHYRYYGRAVSFPYQSSGFHYDSLLFENTTFANGSRIVMQEGNEFGDNIHLNHVTVLNTVENPLQTQGWVDDISITNSIFVNPYMYGYRAVDVCGEDQDYDDFEDGLCDSPGGGLFDVAPVDSFGFTEYVDFTDQERQVLLSNTSYAYKDYMKNWYRDCDWCEERIQNRERDLLHNPYPYLGEATIQFMDSTDAQGNKVFPKMNIDSSTVYLDEVPDFITPPTNQDSMLTFVEFKWSTNADINWAYKPDAGYNQTWPLPENMAYNNTKFQTAAMGEFPLGDLYHWYPDEYERWKDQSNQEWDRIKTWLSTGDDPEETPIAKPVDNKPDGFTLKQNYPNPFNPTTNIAYTVPKASQVSLKVYNTLGREVATLYEGQRLAGNYEVTFDASNLTSGVYFYRLKTENGVSITKKLVLMK